MTERAALRAVPIDERMTLTDRPLADVATPADLRERLARLLRLDQRLHWLCGEASALGLSASWTRLEGVDDDVDDAIAAVRAELRRATDPDVYPRGRP